MDVRKIAHLARLELTDAEATAYEEKLNLILKHAEQLANVDVDGIEPTAHATPVFDVIREDIAHDENFSQEVVLANAPAVALGQIKMPKVVE